MRAILGTQSGQSLIPRVGRHMQNPIPWIGLGQNKDLKRLVESDVSATSDENHVIVFEAAIKSNLQGFGIDRQMHGLFLLWRKTIKVLRSSYNLMKLSPHPVPDSRAVANRRQRLSRAMCRWGVSAITICWHSPGNFYSIPNFDAVIENQTWNSAYLKIHKISSPGISSAMKLKSWDFTLRQGLSEELFWGVLSQRQM